jgi:hypothetical protein
LAIAPDRLEISALTKKPKNEMKKLSKYLVVFLMLAAACTKNHSYEPVNSDIKISIWETIDSTGRSLQFKCETKEIFPCFNYQIVTRFTKYPNSFVIDFTGIYIPEMCLTAFGPALSIIDLGNPGNSVYDIEISVEQSRNSGKLIVTSDYYIIDFERNDRIEFTNPILNRIPENTIWGTIGYHSPDTEPIVESFIETMINMGAKNRSYVPGDYGYFTIDKDGKIEPPQMHGNYFIRPFIFEYSGESDALKEIVRDFGLNFDDKLKILLYNTEGDMFRSWAQ